MGLKTKKKNKGIGKMKKAISTFVLLCAVYTAVFAQESRTLDQAISDSMQYLVERLPVGSKVAVLNFSAATAELSDYVIEELIAYIVNDEAGRLTVVDRRNMEALQGEMDFQMSGEVSDETAQSIGQKLGAQIIISGRFTPLGRNFRMRIQAISVETAAIQGVQTLDVTLDDRLAVLLGGETEILRQQAESAAQDQEAVEQQQVAEAAIRDAWKRNWLFVGARGGASMRLYTLSADVKGDVEPNSIAIEAGAQVGLQITNFLAFQVEALFTTDKLSYSGEGFKEASFQYSSLMFPALLKLTFRPATFLVAAFGGVYITMPLGDMQFESDVDESAAYTPSVPLGYLGGVNIGIKLGPGVLFLDARYAAELGGTSINDGKGDLNVFSRGMISLSLGYELGLINKK
jgi:TolB-like protein